MQGSGPTDGDLDQVITLLRARIDEEFKIRERLDAKQRQAFALAAGLFAVAQTVALRFLDSENTNSHERVGIALAAVIAGAVVAWVGVRLVRGEKLEEQDDVKPAALKEWLEQASSSPTEQYVARHIVSRFSTVADERTSANKTLATKVDGVQAMALVAVVAIGLELLIAVGSQVV